MRYYIIGLFICLILVSCQDANRKYAESVCQKWQHKEVLFPEHPAFSIYGKDTVDYSIKDSEYKIVTYVDSAGCTSCKLNLPRWASLIRQVDSISPNSVEFLFFFFPKEGRDIYHTLRIEKFDHPVCIDKSDSFNKLNHFPSDDRFRTFLLDKGNKVIAIGNPIHNPKIKEIYLDIISGKEIGPKKQEVTTKVEASSMQLDFGSFDWEDIQSSTFLLQNTGQNPLIVQDITTSCGCTTVEYSKEPVPSGKSLDIKVTYKADHPEHFNKTITVYCNAGDSPLRLKIQGNAK